MQYDLNPRIREKQSSTPVVLPLHLLDCDSRIDRPPRLHLLFGQGQGRWLALRVEVKLQFLTRFSLTCEDPHDSFAVISLCKRDRLIEISLQKIFCSMNY